MRTATLALTSLATLALTAFVPAAIAGDVGVQTVFSLDPSVGQNPEGVAVDKKGNVFLSVAPTGDLLRRDKKGNVTTHAHFNTGGGFLLGMTVDKSDNVYIALASFNADQGVYKVTPGGAVSFVASIPGFPNDIAIDKQSRNLYVTESISGSVYKVELKTGDAELWFQDPLLEGNIAVSPVPFPIGANGIAFDDDSVIVANSQQPRLVRIPIDCGGDPMDPEVILEDEILMGADGIALDVHHDIYVAVNKQDLLLKVSGDGEDVDILADESDGLDFPSTVAFGQGAAGMKNLYISNFALFSGPTGHPGLLVADVGVPGKAIP